MEPVPFNLPVLQTAGYLKLHESHRFLVSGSASQLKQWKLVPSQPFHGGQLSLLRHTQVGTVKVSYTGTKVQLAIAGTVHWTVDILRFSGTPKLKTSVAADTGTVTIALTGATFPGLGLSADLTAKLSVQAGTEWLDLQFAFCGFSARTRLVDWLTGTSAATASVFLDDQVCRLAEGVRIGAAGSAVAQFHPSWLFLFGNTKSPLVTLTAAGRSTTAHGMALALLGPGMPSVIPNHADRRAAILIPEDQAFDLPLWPEGTEGWRFDRNPFAPPFRTLAIETDEQVSDHRIRRAIVATGADGDYVAFRPGADLLNDTLAPFAIPLHHPVYAALYLGDGTRLGAALLALRTQTTLTAHTARCTLVLDPYPREPGFLLLQNDVAGTLYFGRLPSASGALHPGLSFKLLATAPHLGPDLVVDPLPPPVSSSMTLTLSPLARPLAHTEGEIAITAGDPHARILLPEWSWTQVVRPRDLLVLGFQFLGLRPEFHGPNPGRLLNSPLPDAPRVLVYLPPQNITEMAAKEEETSKNENFPDAGLQAVPVPAPHRTAGLSRLAFDLPDSVSEIPYTFEQLIDWSGATLRPRLDRRALSPALHLHGSTEPDWPALRPGRVEAPLAHGRYVPIRSITTISPLLSAPPLDTTAIEAPYRLLVSPDQYGYWETEISPTMKDGPRAVLWHALLCTRLEHSVPSIRALFAVDDIEDTAPAPLEHPNYAKTSAQQEYPPTSLKLSQRQALVENSTLKAVDAKRLMLSALGAWLDFDGNWEEFPGQSLIGWQHRATLGRDQYVKVVERGYGFPFGHRLNQVTITERKFGQHPGGRVGAWLRKRVFYVVAQPELTYFGGDDNATPLHSAQSRELPLRKVRILTKVTPLIDVVSPPIEPIPASGAPKGRWLQVIGKDFLFSFEAEDREGNVIKFSAPMAFIPHNKVATNVLANVAGAIKDQSDSSVDIRRSYDFHGQSIAYTEGESGQSAVETTSIAFSATPNPTWTKDSPVAPFFPKIVTAMVTHPALRQFAGKADLQKIKYATPYLDAGYSGANHAGQVFAQVIDGSAIAYGADNPTDKIGGLVTPNLTVGGLSRTHGVVGAADSTGAALARFANGSFDASEYFGDLSAQLLGGISLASILDVIGFSNTDSTTPRWTAQREGSVIVNRLRWETTRLVAASFFRPDGGAKLVLQNEVSVNATDAAQTSATFSASLQNFSLNLLGLIVIPFSEFSMVTEAGRKPEVNVAIGKLKFDGALSFLSEIEENLQLDKFADPPSVDVSAAGLSIGYSLQLPAIQVGAFALQNLALNAAATLPFNGDPFRVRFALSERQSPFLISVSLFTGGGFFALSLGLDGVECLEVSLEFGGSFSLDIGVASGGVYILAGIYFKQEDNVALLVGYVRAGGSLEVLGLINISVEFYLGLAYDGATGKAWGEASMTVEIEILFFSTDVTLTVRREFAGSAADPTLADTMDADTWDNNYIAAFAA